MVLLWVKELAGWLAGSLKCCVLYTGHSFARIVFKIGRGDLWGKIADEFDHGRHSSLNDGSTG